MSAREFLISKGMTPNPEMELLLEEYVLIKQKEPLVEDGERATSIMEDVFKGFGEVYTPDNYNPENI